MISGHAYHDDIQGVLQTALTGVTQYTMRQYRATGVVWPHIAQGDVFSMTFQMSHRKLLDEPLDSVHLHYVPVASANGDVTIDYTWGWFNPTGDVEIPNALPNSGSKTFTLATTDQYKVKIVTLISDLTPPTNEGYSSLLLVKCTRVAPSGTNWGTSNEIALLYMDGHMPVNRQGSYNEYNDA